MEAQSFDTQTHLAKVLAGNLKKIMNRSSRGIGCEHPPLITPSLLPCEVMILSTIGLSMVVIIDHLNVLISEMFS